jgi:hypothetical protein
LITLILPAGGAILTITNLYRLRQLDATSARRLTLAAYVVVALGYTALFLATPLKGSGNLLQSTDASGSTVLSIGMGIASYLVQRQPYQEWRKTHERVPTSPWLGGAGRAIVYALITFAAVVPFFLAGVALGLGGGTGSL